MCVLVGVKTKITPGTRPELLADFPQRHGGFDGGPAGETGAHSAQAGREGAYRRLRPVLPEVPARRPHRGGTFV